MLWNDTSSPVLDALVPQSQNLVHSNVFIKNSHSSLLLFSLTVDKQLLCSRMTAQQPRNPVTTTRLPARIRIYADTAKVLEAKRLK